MKRAEIRRIALALLALAAFGIGAAPLLRFAPAESMQFRETGLARNRAGSASGGPARPAPAPSPEKSSTPSRREDKTSAEGKASKDESLGSGKVVLGGPLPPLPSIPTPVLEIESPEPRYWREASYDTFDGHGWTQRHGTSRRVDCRETLKERGPGSRLDITIKVLKGGLFTQLLAPLFPEKVCVGDTAVYFETASLGLAVAAPLPAGARYTVSSRIEEYSLESLRAASSDYSREIKERYLQLPQGTPSRIRELALTVTAGASNDFDKASKIEAFLGRSGKYPYTLLPPATPEGRNGVDYFLFDIKRGYCGYFASAMVVLLRSIGIPSRAVGGYAPGDWKALTRSVILSGPGHAWVEVYFPGFGWVEFEPTSGGPAKPDLTSSGRAANQTGTGPTKTNTPDTSGANRDGKTMALQGGTKKPGISFSPGQGSIFSAIESEKNVPSIFPHSKKDKKPPGVEAEKKKAETPPRSKREEKSLVSKTTPHAQEHKRRRWLYVLAILLAAVPAGWGARLYWVSLKRSKTGIPGSRRGAAGRSAAVPSAGTADFDIRFPRIEPDLPLYWGTVDPVIEVVVVKPEGAEVSLTVNGEERALPVEKGEYLLEIRHEGRSVVKVVNIIDYGEEIERDFREFIIQHGFENENLTARQLLDRIHKADPGFKRPEKALTLFENYAYGNKIIIREEYIRYYRSGRFGPVPHSVIK